MNAADRSVALIDQALRRRFLVPGDAARRRPSWRPGCAASAGAGPTFAERVLALFERLNARLRSDLGPQAQVGHSYFMVPDLDKARLRWSGSTTSGRCWKNTSRGRRQNWRLMISTKLLDGGSHRAGRRQRVEAL